MEKDTKSYVMLFYNLTLRVRFCYLKEVFMYTLFIDTHYISLHLALFKDGKVIEEIIKNEAKHSSYFIPLLNLLI